MKLKKEVTNGRREIKREPGGKSPAQLVRCRPGGCSCPGRSRPGAPGAVNVSADQIEKLMAERRAAGRAEVEKNEPPEPEQPPQPRDATRAEKEEIVYLKLSELFPFKDHAQVFLL